MLKRGGVLIVATSARTGRLVRLSRREIELLGLIAEARSNKDIAYLMHMTEGSLSQMVSKALRDLDLANRGELLIWTVQHPLAFRHEWVEARLHLPGCLCLGAYCSIMRDVLREE